MSDIFLGDIPGYQLMILLRIHSSLEMSLK
jgi:hypothetical protein